MRPIIRPISIPTVPQDRDLWPHNGLGFSLIRDVWMTPHIPTDKGQNPWKGFRMKDSSTLMGSNLKQKNKRLAHVYCHLLSLSFCPSVNTKAPERTACNFCYSVNLQTRMAGIHWQRAVTEQKTLQWTNPFKHSAFWREWQPAKTGQWSYIAIVSFLMQHCCLSQY